MSNSQQFHPETFPRAAVGGKVVVVLETGHVGYGGLDCLSPQSRVFWARTLTLPASTYSTSMEGSRWPQAGPWNSQEQRDCLLLTAAVERDIHGCSLCTVVRKRRERKVLYPREEKNACMLTVEPKEGILSCLQTRK